MPLIDLLPLWLWAVLFIAALDVVLVVLWHAAVTGSFRFSEPPDPGRRNRTLVPGGIRHPERLTMERAP